jgi:hypothetical protein
MPKFGWGSTSPNASHRSPSARGLPSIGPPVEKSWARPGVEPTALQSGARLPQALSVGHAASRNLHSASAEIFNSSRGHDLRIREAPCDKCTHGPAAYTHIQLPHEHPSPSIRCSADRSLTPSASPLGSQALQITQGNVRLQ